MRCTRRMLSSNHDSQKPPPAFEDAMIAHLDVFEITTCHKGVLQDVHELACGTIPNPLSSKMEAGDHDIHAFARRSLVPSLCEPPPRERRIRVPPCPSCAPATRDCSEKRTRGLCLFSIEPSVVNFGAFAPLKVQSKLLRITNISSSSVRFCILRPASGAFRVSFEKKSCLAPGMTQTVTVYFVPATWNLFRSSLKVIGVPLKTLAPHGTSAVLTAGPSVLHHVPLSSFPELCSLRLPRFLNFGSVSLGATKRMTFTLSNPHPVSFQFAVRVVVNNAAFSVEPLSGDVGAKSTRVLTISYTPQVRATAFFAVEVQVADFASKPMHVEAIGTCCTAGTCRTDRETTVVDVLKQTAVDASTNCWCCPFQQRDSSNSVESPKEIGGLCLEPKGPCSSVSPGRNSGFNTSCIFCKGGTENRNAEVAGAKRNLQRSLSSESVGDNHMGRDEAATRAGGAGAAVGLDDSARVSHFNRRWKATVRAMCLKTCKTVVLGEAPTTELRRQRLISKRRYDVVDLLRRHSERDLFQGSDELPAETVVVPSGWLPLRAYNTTVLTDVLPSNTFKRRKESAEKFARVVSALVRRIRALRRLCILRKVLKLCSHLVVVDGEKTGTTSVNFEKSTAYEAFPKNEEAVKEIEISFVPIQRTTYQEFFQVTSTKSLIPPSLLVRSKIDIADVFVSFDNYESLNPLPPLDYEIMRLPDMETSNAAWHLEPTNRRLLQALLRPADSPSREIKPSVAPLCEEIKFPPVVFNPPVVNAVQLVGPPTTEFRPFISLPRIVETDLGYCFEKVQLETVFKRGPRLSLPCFGDIAVNITRKNLLPQSFDGTLLAEIQGTHAVYGQQIAFASLPYLGKVVGRTAREPNSARKGFDCYMSDTDSDSRDYAVQIPVPPLENYAPDESHDEMCTHGSTEIHKGGEVHESKQDDFYQATGRVSDAWGRRTGERLTRLNEINMTLPPELRMYI